MSLDAKQFRAALGQFATGICVVTTEVEPGQYKGMTINSFSSVSLDPALVLWSIQNDSQCFELFTQAKTFTFSVLAADQQAISNQFATPGQQIVSPEQLDNTLPGALKGCLAHFHCKSWACYPGGDHEIIVGEVTAISQTAAKPLLFWGGGYHLVD